jgi:hypothetical protein
VDPERLVDVGAAPVEKAQEPRGIKAAFSLGVVAPTFDPNGGAR